MAGYTGDQEEQYEPIVTNVSKEFHEMLPNENQAQVNQLQCSAGTHGVQQAQDNIATHMTTKNKLILLVMVLAVIFVISLAAIVLSIVTISLLLVKIDNEITSLATNIKEVDALNSLAIIEQAQNTKLHCGDGIWYRIAYLNMSDPLQQCPSPWREHTIINTAGNVTACGRANSSKGSCSTLSLSMTGGLYSRVCGRVIGYQFATPDGFRKIAENNSIYLMMESILHTEHNVITSGATLLV